MLSRRENIGNAGEKGRCDIRVWSGACEHETSGDSGEKYLCAVCETVAGMDHEVKHDIFPYVSGDYKSLS